MPFKEMRGENSFYTCDRCGIEFQFGRHIYRGKPGPNNTMLCIACAPDPFKVSLTSEQTAVLKAILDKR